MNKEVTIKLEAPQGGTFGTAFLARVQDAICPLVDAELGLSGADTCDASIDDWVVSISKTGTGPLKISATVSVKGDWNRVKE